jgi:hypothetical protein
MPKSCVRYCHAQGADQKLFDRPRGREELIAAGKAEKTFVLTIPPPNAPKPKTQAKPKNDGKDEQEAYRFIRPA